MRRKAIISAIVFTALVIGMFFLGGYIASSTAETPQKAPKTATRQVVEQPKVTISVYGLYEEVNKVRVENNLAPLVLNPLLSQSAQSKCSDIVARNYWSHENPDGEKWVDIKNTGIKYTAAGENLARGYFTDQQVIVSWLNSPTHRNVLLNNVYTDVGYAFCDVGSGKRIVVQHLVAK